VVHCKMGGRSMKAARQLKELGFSQVENLKGGIIDWIDKVDSTLKKY
jgi:rhodanese-related sulfurtransferase